MASFEAGHTGRPPPGRRKPYDRSHNSQWNDFPPISYKAPERQLGDFLTSNSANQDEDRYIRYFDIKAAKQTEEYKQLTKGRKLRKIYQILKSEGITGNILHSLRANGDVYLVALDVETSKRLTEMKGDIIIEKNTYDNKTEGFLFNYFWVEEEPEWIKEQIREDHTELAEEDIYVFTKPDGLATGRVKISFHQHKRPHRLQIGLQSLRVEAPRATIAICNKCQRIGHKENRCRDSRTEANLCLSCRDSHSKDTECSYISCGNCREQHPTGSNECKAIQTETEQRQQAIDQQISLTHVRILRNQEGEQRRHEYKNIGNKQEERLGKLEETVEKLAKLIEAQGQTTQRMMEILEQPNRMGAQKRTREPEEEGKNIIRKPKHVPTEDHPQVKQITSEDDMDTDEEQITSRPKNPRIRPAITITKIKETRNNRADQRRQEHTKTNKTNNTNSNYNFNPLTQSSC